MASIYRLSFCIGNEESQLKNIQKFKGFMILIRAENQINTYKEDKGKTRRRRKTGINKNQHACLQLTLILQAHITLLTQYSIRLTFELS
jgi:hypothetical protein